MRFIWTYDLLQAEALKYQSRSEFEAGNPGAYSAAINRHLMDKLCGHMTVKHCKWTYELILQEALKYKTRKEFADNSPAYKAARRRGILDPVCTHMIELYHKWADEELRQVALQYTSRNAFQKGNVGAYEAARRRNIFDKICAHMPEVQHMWTNEELRQEALKYNTKQEFRNNNPAAYIRAHKRKMIPAICSHMKEQLHHWTYEELQAEALKYSTRTAFQNNSKGAYLFARCHGFLDQICSHMPKHVDQSGINSAQFKWTNEQLKQEALKYQTRTEFAKNSPAYQVALKRGLLPEYCAHMQPVSNVSGPERQIIEFIRCYYSGVKALKLRKKNLIPDKTFICGFDIDAFIPELNKGVEFDGKYYHSFEHMRRSKDKNKWSDEDIRNYHQIKDDCFRSIGIEIIHVKEEDWDIDSDQELAKVLAFLKKKSNKH